MSDTTETPQFGPRGEFTMTRVFDAPPKAVYAAWIEPEQFAKWFGPKGMSVPLDSIQIDPRPGGAFNCTMVSDEDGTEYPNNGEFVEIVENERLVMLEPGIGMTTAVHFNEIEGGKTELVVLQTDVPEEFRGPDATEGWSTTLDCLAEHLAA